MKNTKQVLALAMAVAMAAGLLAGCGGGGSGARNSSSYSDTRSTTRATASFPERKNWDFRPLIRFWKNMRTTGWRRR